MTRGFVFCDGARPAAVLVLVVTTIVTLLGFTALTIDMGYLYNLQAELQATADAAALAGASQLGRGTVADGRLLAQQEAVRYAVLNRVDRRAAIIDPTVDLEYGTLTVDPQTGKFGFAPVVGRPTALRVTVRKTSGSPNGAAQLFFAHIFGHSKKDLWARATAAIIPRDIALVIDLSGSMNDDSELRHIDMARINLYEIWEDLGRPEFGLMTGWGFELEEVLDGYWTQMEWMGWGGHHLSRPYDPRDDPGLVYIPYAGTSTIMEMLGLNDVPYPYPQGNWEEYINYVKSSQTAMAEAGFRHCYGLKTFINFLIERKNSHAETPALAHTRLQPLYAVKMAARELMKVVASLENADRVSLEVYGRTTHHEVDLTADYQAVLERLDDVQAGYYDNWSNIGGGLREAIRELTGPRARPYAVKVIVLLTDGIANTNEVGAYDPPGATNYALHEANEAARQGIRIYTISVGSRADRQLMQQIAQIGKGTEFFAGGPVETYTKQLQEIFASVGGKHIAALIE